jgi:hypothetical protein
VDDGATVDAEPKPGRRLILESAADFECAAQGRFRVVEEVAAGASINLCFLLGVEQNSSFRFSINVEAMP